MRSSVTVSMGDERKGVLRVMFRVTLHVSVSNQIGSAASCSLGLERHDRSGEADVAGKHEEVVVGETTVPLRVHQLAQSETISSGVLLEQGQSVGGAHGGFLTSGRSRRASVGVSVDDGTWHGGRLIEEDTDDKLQMDGRLKMVGGEPDRWISST